MHNTETSYDTIAYPGYTHPQTHPDRLAVIARLRGLDSPPVTRCRVLDVGCGNGSNLIPMSYALPDSEFVGFDLAARPVLQGQEMIRDLSIQNIRLVNASLADVNETWGKFDYIIAHGFYSWVPPEAQEQLLAVCRDALSPNGVAFVSYNTLPGCHLRKMVREMMLFHTRDLVTPQEKVSQAIALVRFLAEAQDVPDPFRLWMKAELKTVAEHEEGHLYHDELAALNEPLYFVQFMERAARHDLQYLGEADYFEMFDHGFSESTRQTLNQLSPNRILREQYLDFLKCRRFRQTLLCHRAAHLLPEAQPALVARFVISSTAGPAADVKETLKGVTSTFETAKGGRFETDYDLGKAAVAILQEYWPQPLPFAELLSKSIARLEGTAFDQKADGHSDRLSGFLLQLYSAGLVGFRTVAPPLTTSVSDHPAASPIARWQAQRGNVVTSLLHSAVKLEDEVGRSLLLWLDGSNNHPSLLEKLHELLKSKNALTAGDEAATAAKLKADLQRNLTTLARIGLLVA